MCIYIFMVYAYMSKCVYAYLTYMDIINHNRIYDPTCVYIQKYYSQYISNRFPAFTWTQDLTHVTTTVIVILTQVDTSRKKKKKKT